MTGALSLLAGILGGFAWPFATCALVLIALAACVCSVWAHWARAAAWACIGVALAAGVAWHWERHLVRPSAADAVDSRVLLDARIASVPARAGVLLRFDADVHLLAGAAGKREVMRRARLTWRHARVAPRVGERWQLLVRLEPAAPAQNFAGVDTERIAFREGLHLAGTVLPSALNERRRLANQSLDGVRARVAARICDAVADPDAAGLITALAVGLTDRVSGDQWRVFNATGTTHLVAISGLHVTLFALVAFLLARRIWGWLRVKRIDREPFAWTLGLAAAGGYALLAGLSVPTLRTWIMLAVFGLARLAARHVGTGRVWALAMFAVLLADPRAPLAAGFWLSFAAVGVILFVASRVSHVPADARARVIAALRLQVAVMVALAPLTFAVFDSVSLSGLAVNLVAIPLVSFVFVPLVLAGTLACLVEPGVGAWAFGAAAWLYELAWPALSWAADGELASWRAAPAAWWLILAVPASAVALLRLPWIARLTGLAVALPLVFAPAQPTGVVRLEVLDAGRGAAVLVHTRSRTWLYDTGDGWGTAGAPMRRVVFPALDTLARRGVDVLVLPALEPDRAGGAALLAVERGLRGVVAGGGWPGTSLPAQACGKSRQSVDGVQVETFVVAAPAPVCVLRVAVGEHSVLLAPDIDAAPPAEALITLRAGARADARQWIEAGGGALRVAAGGIAGSAARERALERWREAGVCVIDTLRTGGVTLRIDGQGVAVLRVARRTRHPFVWRRFRYDPGPCGKS